jgi:DNA-binding beta-propeller fold protein YncE
MSNPWATTGTGPRSLATDGTYIYCANFNSNSISRISLTNPPVVENTWATGINQASGLAIDVANGFLYCSYISGASSGRIAKLTLGNTPTIDLNWKIVGTMFGINDLAIDSLSNFLYCATGSNRISKISLTGGIDQLNWASPGIGPKGLAINGGFIYVSLNNTTISKITLTDPPVITSSWATTGLIPQGLVIDSGYIYCANNSSNTISKISLTNPSTENNSSWALTGSSPFGLAINTGFIYESNFNNSTIWKISLTTPCFNKGTKILCLNKMMEEEYIPIEDLKKGDLVKSYLHGYRKIDSIGGNKMINNPEHFNLSMYKMEKTLENGLTEDLIVTGGHSILVDDLGEYYAENEIRFKGTIPKIDDKFLLLCFLTKDFTQLTDTNEYTYYHLCLENNGNNDERFGIWANGILTETISKNQFTEIEQILLHF